jgi:hypothetical protein
MMIPSSYTARRALNIKGWRGDAQAGNQAGLGSGVSHHLFLALRLFRLLLRLAHLLIIHQALL